MSERRSWIVEKNPDDSYYSHRGRPIEGEGKKEYFGSSFLRNRAPYFVVYEGSLIPNTLCECGYYRIRYGLSVARFAHEYNWGDVPWIELVAWGF